MAGLDPITSIINLGNTLVDRLLPDKAQNDAAKAELTKLIVSGEIQQIAGQIQIDAVEASSNSVFVAGWRPFVGWICGLGFGYQFVIQPFLTFLVKLHNPNFTAPLLDVSTLSELLMALLGMGALRTVDKVKGVDNGH